MATGTLPDVLKGQKLHLLLLNYDQIKREIKWEVFSHPSSWPNSNKETNSLCHLTLGDLFKGSKLLLVREVFVWPDFLFGFFKLLRN